MKYAALILAFFAFLPVTAPVSAEEAHVLTVEKAWARKTRRTMSAAAYMTLKNNEAQAVSITSVSSPIAKETSLHQSYEADGIMRMDHVESATIEAGSSLVLEPGSYHIMMMMLEHPLEEGTHFPVVLKFEDGRTQTIEVQVTGMDGMGMKHHP